MNAFKEFFQSAMGTRIYEAEDDLGKVCVFDKQDNRILTFGTHFEQSSVCRSHPVQLQHHYTQAIATSLVLHDPQRITLFGLGGGALVHYLLHTLPHVNLKVVELRSLVIEVASAYFYLPSDKRLQVIQADAFRYIRDKADASTDLLIADLYLGHGLDLRQMTREFLRQCARVITDKGWVVCNFIAEQSDVNQVVELLQDSFQTVLVCTVTSGNIIVYAALGDVDFSKQQLVRQSRKLQTRLGFRVEPYIMRLMRFS